MVTCPHCNKEFEIEPQVVEIEGWKGKGEISVTRRGENYLIVENRKSKETRESYQTEHLVPKDNVKTIWELIKNKCQIGVEYKYKFLVRVVLEHYKFHEKEGQDMEKFMEAINGGRWRAIYYFPYIYFPLKILEKEGLIIYYGRGGFTRISEDCL
jgi:hypothetical protein